MTDLQLLMLIKENPESFSLLFKQYYQPIFGYVLRRIGDFDSAADVSAETFLKAYLNIHRFNYRGIAIKVWLYRIATNEINQHFRKHKKRNLLFENIGPKNKFLFDSYLSDDKNEIEQELQKHEQFKNLQTQLKSLPIKYQEVIALKYFEGKNNSEIQEILDIPMGTIKSLLSRGIEKLKNKITLNKKEFHEVTRL